MKTVINFESPYTEQSLHDFLADPVTLAYCWKLTPRAGSIITTAIGATSHTRDLTLPGHGSLVFRRAGGIKPTAVDTEAGQESAGLNFLAVFDDDAITPIQLDEGDWDGALLEIFKINYAALKMGQMIEFSGHIGGFTEEGIVFTADARPLTALARIKVGRRASANCDVREFGDPVRCQRSLVDLTHSGTVTTGDTTGASLRASALPAAVLFTMLDGKVTFTSGQNAGRTRVVRDWNNSSGEIIFQKAFPFPIAISDNFTAVEGCNRTEAACLERDNIINYQGLNFMTNIEKFNRIRRAQ